MKNQKGVTLVELLIVILIMGVITTVAITLVSVSMKSEREVSSQNQIQREARLIMEFMTERMRDGAKWELVNANQFALKDGAKTHLTFTKLTGDKGKIVLGESGNTLSENVIFSLPDYNQNPVTVKLVIDNGNDRIELTSNIYYQRFRNN
ncbi:MAG: type II secretion system GspH family protein [Bacillaceae bacterium]|nr:type II secretion system GspH family protein [Bacillaceae bacterium]